MKEYLFNDIKEYTVAVQGNSITSLRVKQKETNTFRIYKDGYIGIGGSIGKLDLDKLKKKANDMLELKIEYPEILSDPVEKSISMRKNIIKENDLVKICEELLNKLTKACPNFIFSNFIYLRNSLSKYENDAGRKLYHDKSTMDIALCIKDKASANIMDADFYTVLTDYNEDDIVNAVRNKHEKYFTEVEIAAGEYPIMLSHNDLYHFMQLFEGRSYAVGSSLLSGKMGQKIFNEKLNITTRFMADKAFECFFDSEGVFLDDNSFYFVKDGVLSGLLTNKKYAKEYGFALSGSAAAAYDSVPSIGLKRGGFVPVLSENQKEALSGKVIYIDVVSGGDMTPSGEFSTPVMVAFLLEDGVVKGKIKGDFGITGNIFEMLGENYIGCVNDLEEFSVRNAIKSNYYVTKMKVMK